jgi:RND family efflux transporter MFP subunit
MRYLTMALAASLLAACSRPPEKTEDIRPVRVMRLAAAGNTLGIELAGEVVPRYESRIGFRVGGKIVERKIEIGSTVRRGQPLMQLDPTDLQLSQAQARAAVGAAESSLTLAKAELDRYRELRQKNFVSQAVLDAKESAYRSALSGHEQAVASLKVQSNQRSYATLAADADGVVTGLDAEVGQVVAPGTPVVRIARSGGTEVRVSIPEDQVEALRRATSVTVRTWANPGVTLEGSLREVSPVADPATRTFTAKITLPKAGPEVRLGMTATVSFALPAADSIRLPMTALFEEQGKTAVWVVDNDVVRRVPVQLAGANGNEILVAAGLEPGQTVVTAGVNLLREGQKVAILGQPAKAANAGAAK